MVTATVTEQRTFGEHLIFLRGKERLADVARRSSAITSQHLSQLEEKRAPGEIKPKTLMALADAYWEGHYPSKEAAFWDLWQRAGYPLPPGFAELSDQARRLVANWEALDPEERSWLLREAEIRAARRQPPER